jgi:osmotically-inducible protein OsmY
VVPKGGPDNIEVADGFAGTSEGAEERAGVPGDDEITAHVKDLLRIDAATSTLDLDVETVDGVVYLRGTVPGFEDTDVAAEVAARVPGVVDVVDEMTVQG